MRSKIFVINGLGGSGKSTFVNFCKNYANEISKNKVGITVFELSSVDFVKQVANFCGWTGEKETKDREFLHELKMALEKWNNIPEKKVVEDIYKREEKLTKKKFLYSLCPEATPIDFQNFYFVNIREKQSIKSFMEVVKDKFDCYSILMVNSNHISNEASSVISEINDFNYDYVIKNNGDLIDLHLEAKKFMNNFISVEEKMANTFVISAFPCSGKTSAVESLADFYDFSDSDSSNFSWLDKEKGIRNPDFPNNYITHIKSLIGKKDIVFVSTHKAVREALKEAGISYYLVFPANTEENKKLWKQRMIDREDSDAFISNIMNNWDDMIEDMNNDFYPVQYQLGCYGNRNIIDANTIEDIMAAAIKN